MFGRRSSKLSSEAKPSLAGKPSYMSDAVTVDLPSRSDIVPSGPQLNLDIKLQRGKVYIAMFAMASANYYHWALAIATNERSGMLYHNTNQGGPYAFKANYHSHLLNSSSLLALVEISSITPLDRTMHQRFAERLKSVPVGNLTCRPWLLKAIRLVAEEGFLGIEADKDDILRQLEEECLVVASNAQRRRAVFVKSRVYRD